MSQRQENLERLKAAYKAWNDTRGGSVGAWRELMADAVRLNGVDETSAGLDFARDRVSREDAVAYLTGILDSWEMLHYTPETYVSEGDIIAMFGRCGWRNKRTGKVADCRISNLWKFEGGTTDLFDSAVAAAAATPD